MAEDGDDDTHVRVEIEVWRRLNALRQDPSESYNEVIKRLLEDADVDYEDINDSE